MVNRLQLENIPLLGSRGLPSLGSRGAPIPEEGSNTHGLRDPLDRKRQKEEGLYTAYEGLEETYGYGKEGINPTKGKTIRGELRD